VSEAAKPAPTFTHLAALLPWLVLQLLALALPTLQVPLSDDFPRPTERVAVQEMVIVQVLSAAMLFPMLRNVPTTIAVIASTWPFLQLAGMLAGTPAPRLLCATLYLAMWMITLALANSMLRSRRARLRAAAFTTSFALAGPLFWYLRHEFASDAAANEWLVVASPILSVFAILNRARQSVGTWIFMTALLVSSLGASMLVRRRASNRDNLSTPHPQALPTPPRTPPVF
jgi:hypothetical protein